MRAILILCFFAFHSFSQEKVKVERFWLNYNHGFNHYNELGGNLQIRKQLLLGAYFQSYDKPTGPGLATNPNPYALFTSYSYKRNKVNSASLMIGFASPQPHPVIVTFLVGPSINRSVIHTNVHIAQTNNGSKYLASTRVESWDVGLNYKAGISFCLGPRFALNFGLAGNYNRILSYNKFIIGLGVGMMNPDRSSNSRNKKNPPKRITIIRK